MGIATLRRHRELLLGGLTNASPNADAPVTAEPTAQSAPEASPEQPKDEESAHKPTARKPEKK